MRTLVMPAIGNLTLREIGVARCDQLVLERIGNVKSCGPTVGDGQRVKLVNQVLATSHIVAAAEALPLAARLALEHDNVLKLLRGGAGGSWILQDRGTRMNQPSDKRDVLRHHSILAKDAQLALQAAADAGLDAAVFDAVAGQWKNALDLGLGHQDDASVIDVYVP